MIEVGIDWAEDHHDVAVLANRGGCWPAGGSQRAWRGWPGCTPCWPNRWRTQRRSVGVETDRGLLVGALVAAGYQVYAVDPRAVDRYRDRHGQAGAKSDAGDARVLADLVRTDRHQHRRVAGDSELGEAIKILARSHQNLIWTRQRLANQLRSTLRKSPGRAGRLRRVGQPGGAGGAAVAPTRRVVGA